MNPNAANLITLSRIAAAAVLAFVPPCSGLFGLCYLWGGVSDLLDGMVARLMKHQSPAGARLDSIADLILVIALLFLSWGISISPGGYGNGLFALRCCVLPGMELVYFDTGPFPLSIPTPIKLRGARFPVPAAL